MMEVIDNIATSRGRYNDLALSADDSSISSHRSSPNKKQSLEIDDDDISGKSALVLFYLTNSCVPYEVFEI